MVKIVKRKNVFGRKKGVVASRLLNKALNNGFILALSIGSLIGFIINTVQWFTNDINSFQWLSVLLGIGLLLEGGIVMILRGNKSRKKIMFAKIITLAIGAVVLVGGIMTIPSLSVYLSDKMIGGLGIVNVVAVFVIAAEIFLID